jgi:hypothetical protein
MDPGAVFIFAWGPRSSLFECWSLRLPQSQWLSCQTMVAPIQCFPMRRQTVQFPEGPCSMRTSPLAGTSWDFSVLTRMGLASRPTLDTLKEQTLD